MGSNPGKKTFSNGQSSEEPRVRLKGMGLGAVHISAQQTMCLGFILIKLGKYPGRAHLCAVEGQPVPSSLPPLFLCTGTKANSSDYAEMQYQ